MWRVMITDGLAAEGQKVLQESCEIIESRDLSLVASVEAMIVRGQTKVTAQVIAAGLPRLKVIGRAGVGVDNIDLPAARTHKVAVVNAPEATTISVAEHALALMFALARQVAWADAEIHQGRWPKMDLKGSELSGKTLGLVGIGRIGGNVARRASALGMSVIAHDPYLDDEQVLQHGAQPAEMENLLAEADFVSLHVPLNDRTRALIGPDQLARMKAGAFLINTSRGGIVDEAALLRALEQGQLAGVALDVFLEEPPGASPLTQHPRVLCTPHIAAQTREAQVRASVDIASEVLAALRGEPLRWQVA